MVLAMRIGSGMATVAEVEFDLLVMDEATQMTTLDMLIALAREGRHAWRRGKLCWLVINNSWRQQYGAMCADYVMHRQSDPIM